MYLSLWPIKKCFIFYWKGRLKIAYIKMLNFWDSDNYTSKSVKIQSTMKAPGYDQHIAG